MFIHELLELKKNNKITTLSDTIVIKKYIPVVEKNNMVKSIIDTCIDFDNGCMKLNSYKKYLTFNFAVIEAHTDLRFSDTWDDRVSEYDALCEAALMDEVIGTFKADYDACASILNMECEDLFYNNSIEAGISKIATSIVENLDILMGVISDKIEGLDIEKILPSGDLDKLKGFLSKIK